MQRKKLVTGRLFAILRGRAPERGADFERCSGLRERLRTLVDGAAAARVSLERDECLCLHLADVCLSPYYVTTQAMELLGGPDSIGEFMLRATNTYAWDMKNFALFQTGWSWSAQFL